MEQILRKEQREQLERLLNNATPYQNGDKIDLDKDDNGRSLATIAKHLLDEDDRRKAEASK